jgi:hypothetical protein
MPVLYKAQEDSMRRVSAIPLALAATLTLWAVPAQALDRTTSPGGGTIIVQVADLDRPAQARRRHHRVGRVASHRHWRYRAAYTRWLFNEYVVAGYPVNQYRSRTYYWVGSCCVRHHRYW